MKKIILFLWFLSLALLAYTQDSLKNRTNPHNSTFRGSKKILIGASFNNSWTSLIGLEPQSPFFKPSIGGHLKVEYRVNNKLSLNGGIGFQQRGCGIYTPDYDASDNKDSTHRLRIRFNTISLPFQLHWCTKKEILPNARLCYSVGAAPYVLFKATRIFHSIEDGFHVLEDYWDRSFFFDIPVRGAIGVDINATDASLLRVQIIGDIGFIPQLRTTPNSSYSGLNALFGIEVSALF